MTIESLKALQTRIREATGPDWELDSAIFRALELRLPEKFLNLGITLEWQADGSAVMPVGGMQVRYEPPAFTTYPEGLGACVALMMEVLPGRLWSRNADGYFWIHVDRGTIYSRRVEGEKCANDCLTFIDAIISARIAELEAEQKEKANV